MKMVTTQGMIGITSVAIFVSCVSSSDIHEIVTPKPTLKMAKVSGKSYDTLKQGHQIYHQNCAQCHEHRLPDTANVPAWHDKISKMATRAALTKDEKIALQSYLDEFTDR